MSVEQLNNDPPMPEKKSPWYKRAYNYCSEKGRQLNAWIDRKLEPIVEPLSDWAAKNPIKGYIAAGLCAVACGAVALSPIPGTGAPGAAGLTLIKKIHRKSCQKHSDMKAEIDADMKEPLLSRKEEGVEHERVPALQKELDGVGGPESGVARVTDSSLDALKRTSSTDPKVNAIVEAVQKNAIVNTKSKEPKGPDNTPARAKGATQAKGQEGGVANT